MDTKTNIQNFFAGKTIFVTGATGLLGNILVEKLLRSCPDVKNIYILIRGKWNSSSEKRFEELLNLPMYDNLRQNNPEQLKKIIPVKGNLEEPKLGLSDTDIEEIVENVNCVFHAAASIKIVDPLSKLLRSNLLGTNEIIQLGKKIKNLQSLIYVSTAYSQCTRKIVDEVLYESKISSETMLILSKTLDSSQLDQMSPILVGDYPNAYTFTKSLSEDLIRRTASDLPTAIVRPTIVCSSWKEPLPGWTNSLHSLSNFMAAYGTGIAHVLIAEPHSVADIIPADTVIHNMIAAAWEVGTFWSTTDKSVRVYNCASSHQNPITTGRFEELLDKYDPVMPTNYKLWHRFVFVSPNQVLITVMYLLQLPLMYFLDLISYVMGQPRRALKLYKKAHTLITVSSHFVKNSWLFTTHKTSALWDKLEENDKQMFDFNISGIDWDSVFYSCVKGIRLYLLNENPKTIPKAQFKSQILKVVHYMVLAFWFFVLLYCVFKIFV